MKMCSRGSDLFYYIEFLPMLLETNLQIWIYYCWNSPHLHTCMQTYGHYIHAWIHTYVRTCIHTHTYMYQSKTEKIEKKPAEGLQSSFFLKLWLRALSLKLCPIKTLINLRKRRGTTCVHENDCSPDLRISDSTNKYNLNYDLLHLRNQLRGSNPVFSENSYSVLSPKIDDRLKRWHPKNVFKKPPRGSLGPGKFLL